MRLKLVHFAVIGFFLFLGLIFFNLQVIKGKEFREQSFKNSIRLLPQEGSRGRILDRWGNPIVDNKLTFDVTVLPQDLKYSDELLTHISESLGKSFKDLKNKFRTGFSPFTAWTIAENISLREAIALEELKPEFPGIVIQPKPTRIYHYARLACHIIGYLGEIDRWRLTKLKDFGYKIKDTVGFGGIEEKYDYYLRQEEGGLSVEVDHRGRLTRVLGFRTPQNGKDVQLTLDLKMQKISEDNLNGKVGCVILMDPSTGEILAMASYPNFNPSVFVKKSDSSIQGLLNDSAAPLINRAISGLYPAGSIFKLVISTTALEIGKINLLDTFFCAGTTHIGKQEFSCWDTHGTVNLQDAITRSCNIFFYKTGLIIGAQVIHDWALKFGFAKPTSIDLPYEESGFLPHPLWKKFYRFKNWSLGDTANLSIGQGDLLVTPLQVSRMMAIFANKGRLVTPYIVKAVGGKDISHYQKKISILPIKENNLEHIREYLRNVVTHPKGTAHVLSALPVSIAGKTGTAQAPPYQAHGWFTGFFPYKNPKFVICVFLERAGSGYAATLLAKQIIENMIKEGLL